MVFMNEFLLKIWLWFVSVMFDSLFVFNTQYVSEWFCFVFCLKNQIILMIVLIWIFFSWSNHQNFYFFSFQLKVLSFIEFLDGQWCLILPVR